MALKPVRMVRAYGMIPKGKVINPEGLYRDFLLSRGFAVVHIESAPKSAPTPQPEPAPEPEATPEVVEDFTPAPEEKPAEPDTPIVTADAPEPRNALRRSKRGRR